MDARPYQIKLNYTDPKINSYINEARSENDVAPATYTQHYSQNEEFFIKLDRVYTVPSFPIHHDVRDPIPTDRYLETVRQLLGEVIPLVPDLFEGLTYYFDPSDILRPSFFQLYRLADEHYLYLLKIDLSHKPAEHESMQSGTNDSTAAYRSSTLPLDGIVIPVDEVHTENGRLSSFTVKQTVSQTWIGETGRGYFVQGIWMDHELTKFFSKLFTPTGKRLYPFYPFQCRYRTICSTVIATSAAKRRITPPLLHRALQFVLPVMDHIQESLKDTDFSEQVEIFRKLKPRVPEFWNSIWKDLQIKPYLNSRDMKEFVIES